MVDKTYRDALIEAEVRMTKTSESVTYVAPRGVSVTTSPCPTCGSMADGRHYVADIDESESRRAQVLYLALVISCLVGAVAVAYLARTYHG